MTTRNWMMMAAALLPVALTAPPAWARGGPSGGTTCATRVLAEAVASTGLDADGSARARWRLDDRCRQDFAVELQDVPVGAYELAVAGVVRGRIAVAVDATGRTRGEIEFEAAGDDTPHALPLDFDPVGAVLEIRGAAGIYFADVFDGVAGAATPAPTRTAAPTRREDAGTPTRAATRTRTARPTSTVTAPRALRTATPPRTPRTATPRTTGARAGSFSWFGWRQR